MKRKIELNPKVAAEMAIQYVKDLFPGIKNVELEEIRNSVDWYVTLSMPAFPFLDDEASKTARKYKVITIQGRWGKVESMRMR